MPDGTTITNEQRGGAAVLVAGPLSERWMIEGGHTSRRGVVAGSIQFDGGRLGRQLRFLSYGND